MDLIDEQYTWDQVSLVLFLPLSDLEIDLVSYFCLDFSCLSGEQSHESLGSGIDDIYVVKGYCMDYFFSLKDLSFRALSKSGLRGHSIILRCFSKAPAKLGNLATRFVNGNDVTCGDFFCLNSFDHF
jgi:hypothetical protein